MTCEGGVSTCIARQHPLLTTFVCRVPAETLPVEAMALDGREQKLEVTGLPMQRLKNCGLVFQMENTVLTSYMESPGHISL